VNGQEPVHNGAARSQQRTVYTTSFLRLFIMDDLALASTIEACRLLISDRFPDDENHGAAAMLLDDGTILTGTAPAAINPSVEVCHEIEPFCGAHRLGRQIAASGVPPSAARWPHCGAQPVWRVPRAAGGARPRRPSCGG